MKKAIGVFPFLFLALLCGCGAAPAQPPQEILQTAKHLPENLCLEPFQNISNVMEADGWFSKDPETRITIYQYGSSQEASEKFSAILPGGTAIESADGLYIPQWSQTPHFYLEENQIIAYFGDDESLINQLEQSFA